MNRPLVIGNWKMNHDVVEAVHLTQQLTVMLSNRPASNVDVVVAPPFVDLRSVASVLEAERSDVALGAQHVNVHESGAHTGEVSLGMLARVGVSWVIVGHSERRANYAMDDALVTATLARVTRGSLRGVLCVGESEAVRDANGHGAFVRAQLVSALSGLEAEAAERVTVAYEPIWAIGTGRSATSEQVAEMTTVIRDQLASLGLSEARVLYGGSANPENAASLVIEGGVDGFLVGGASLSAEPFLAIVHACDDCYAVSLTRR